MAYELLTLEREGPIAVMTLNRPDRLNALNTQLQDETRAACAEVEEDDDLRAMIVTGAGRAFSAGVDLTGNERNPDDDIGSQNERLDEYSWVGRQAMAFYRMTKPTIAAVNGVCVGAGMSMACACDLRVGSELTRFKTVFVERSISPDSGLTFFLPRIVGYARAVDLVFTSRNVDSEEAYRLGLLDRVVTSEQLLDESLELANTIAKWPPMAIRSAKRTIQRNLQADLEEALRNERAGLDFAGRAPHDRAESRASFFEKREPRFTGR
jgi:2-(1,2-epoxy-1,2-dihydrophenyl)acetyl-CoA isomerase